MGKLNKTDIENIILDYEIMDTIHSEFVDIYNSVDLTSNESIKSKAIELLIHTKNHFKKEENLMSEYSYSRTFEHKNEHNKVLAELQFFIDKSSSVFGMNILKSYYTQKLPHWFHLHLISMDSDLSGYLKKFSSIKLSS